MKNIIMASLVIATTFTTKAQIYTAKEGATTISFFSKAPMEDIEAVNKGATIVFRASTADLQISISIQNFRFKNALMEEHFNENYMESSKFPKAKFTGSIDNAGSLNLSKDGKYNVTVSGNLEIHGVTKPVTSTAEFIVKGGKITANSSLKILVADYGIDIPSLVKDKIAKQIDIKIQATYEAMAKS